MAASYILMERLSKRWHDHGDGKSFYCRDGGGGRVIEVEKINRGGFIMEVEKLFLRYLNGIKKLSQLNDGLK